MLTKINKQILKIILLFTSLLVIYQIVFFFYFHGSKDLPTLSDVVMALRFDIRWGFMPGFAFLLLGSFKFLNPSHSRTAQIVWTVLFVLVFLFTLLVLCLDFGYYAYLNLPLDAYIIDLAKDTKASIEMVWQSYPVLWISLGLLLLVACSLGIFSKLLKPSSAVRSGKRKRILNFIFMFLFLGLSMFGKIGQYPLRWSEAFNNRSVEMAYVVLPPFESFYNTLKFRGQETYDMDQVQQAYGRLSDFLGVDSPDAAHLSYTRHVEQDSLGLTEDYNVVLILAESFAAHKSSSFGCPLPTTPNFDQIAAEGLLYDRCFAPVPWSAQGAFATIVGVPDFEIRSTASRNPRLVEQNVLINQLTGYERLYFIGLSLSWANMRGFLSLNIEDLETFEEFDYKAPRSDVWGVGDRDLLLEANGVLAKQAKPFFAVLHLASNHEPYTITDRDVAAGFKHWTMSQDSIELLGFKSVDELNAYRLMDFNLGLFMTAAKQEDYFKKTIFIIIGDHGTSAKNMYAFSDVWTEVGMYRYHIPLLYYCPELLKAERSHKLASQMDVLPTAMGILNKPYINSGLGRDLRDTVGNEMIFLRGLQGGFSFCGILYDSVYVEAPIREGATSKIYDYSMPPLPQERLDALRDSLSPLGMEYFHTVRYMIRNNKPRKQVSKQ